MRRSSETAALAMRAYPSALSSIRTADALARLRERTEPPQGTPAALSQTECGRPADHVTGDKKSRHRCGPRTDKLA